MRFPDSPALKIYYYLIGMLSLLGSARKSSGDQRTRVKSFSIVLDIGGCSSPRRELRSQSVAVEEVLAVRV